MTTISLRSYVIRLYCRVKEYNGQGRITHGYAHTDLKETMNSIES